MMMMIFESIQFTRGQKFSKKKKKKKKNANTYTFHSLSLEYRFEKYFRIESNWEKRVFSRIFEEGMEVSSFTKRKRRTIESFLLHAFQDFQKRGGGGGGRRRTEERGGDTEREERNRRAQFVAAISRVSRTKENLDNNCFSRFDSSGLASFVRPRRIHERTTSHFFPEKRGKKLDGRKI